MTRTFDLLGEGPFFDAVERNLWFHGLQPTKLGEPHGEFAIAAGLDQVLKQGDLDLYPRGVWGYHPSLLPRHRGPNAIVAAVLAGDEEIGGSVYRFTNVVNGGQVLFKQATKVKPTWVTFDPEQTARNCYRHFLFGVGVQLLTETTEYLLTGQGTFEQPQDEALASWHGEDGHPAPPPLS